VLGRHLRPRRHTAGLIPQQIGHQHLPARLASKTRQKELQFQRITNLSQLSCSANYHIRQITMFGKWLVVNNQKLVSAIN
jgi:hypothetical protein